MQFQGMMEDYALVNFLSLYLYDQTKVLAGGGAIVFKNVEGGFTPDGNNANIRFAAITLEK